MSRLKMRTTLYLVLEDGAVTNFYSCVRLISFLIVWFLRFFAVRQSSERRYNFVECSDYPPPSSRPSFDTKESMIKEYIAADGNDYHTAKRKVRMSVHPASCTRSSRIRLSRETVFDAC